MEYLLAKLMIRWDIFTKEQARNFELFKATLPKKDDLAIPSFIKTGRGRLEEPEYFPR